MNDYLDFLEQYKDFKEISDLIDEVNKLREYNRTQQYVRMRQYINELTNKYFIETLTWNGTHPSMPTTAQQAYLNAESFLRLKGFSLLIEKGVKLQDRLTSEELSFIQSTIRPTT